MPPSYFPMRWESTGDHWWYASPIDWAAANGHYDIVLELLRLDANLLIKLTSLRRIHRLEIVWDDDAEFADAAMCRSIVARNLLLECESKKGKNSLIGAGYGGWLLYTAASAGDVPFIQELLERDPLLVFGEGEYGVTDIFYAAARSKNSEAFRLLFDHSVKPHFSLGCHGELEIESCESVAPIFKWEMMNRAVHAAARGGNLEILREFLGDCSDVLAYRDAQGSTVLHAASGRGQVKVVKELVGSFDIINARDNQGNIALHVAAYQGHLSVVEVLIHASLSSTSLINNAGDTFLHMAIAGFTTPDFRLLDRQIELMKQLVCGKIVNLRDIINVRNNDGRTALHMAVAGNVRSTLVELLMTVERIDLNIRDIHGMTPLDLLSQHPRSASSEILTKQLTSAGGISNSRDHMSQNAIASQLKIQCKGCSSPGTSFRIPDSEILLYTGIGNGLEFSGDKGSARLSSCSSTSRSESGHFKTGNENHGLLGANKRLSPINYAARHLRILLGWTSRNRKKDDYNFVDSYRILGDNDSMQSYKKPIGFEDTIMSLRQQFSKRSILPNHKRTLSVGSSLPSPTTRKRFAAGLMHGVIQAVPHFNFPSHSPSSSFSKSPLSSPMLLDKQKGIQSDTESGEPSCSKTLFDDGSQDMSPKSTLANVKMMSQYLCFGPQGLSEDETICGSHSKQAYKRSLLSMA